jgi:hypothetical protein
MPSQNLRLALWMPTGAIAPGEGVVANAQTPAGEPAETAFTPSSGGGNANMMVSPSAPASPANGDLWLDVSNPTTPNLKVFETTNGWVVMAMGKSLPQATRHGQTVVAGVAPNFDFTAGDLDGARY